MKTSTLKQSIIMAAICAAATLPAQADPTTAAPTPAVDASSVMSLYSDAYDQATTWLVGAWGQSTSYSEVQIEENNTVHLTNFNYLGWEFSSDIDVSAMTYLHVDVYTEDALTFKVTPIWREGEGQNEKLYTCTTETGKWNSVDIPLSAYPGCAKIFQIKFDVQDGSQLYTAWIDNVYFYTAAADGTAPTLTAALASVSYNSATLTVNASDNQSSEVTVEVATGADFNDIKTTTTVAANSTDQTVTVTGLTPETQYNLYVRAKDAAGNTSEVVNLTATTTTAPSTATYVGVLQNELFGSISCNATYKVVYEPSTNTITSALTLSSDVVAITGFVCQQVEFGSALSSSTLSEYTYTASCESPVAAGETIGITYSFAWAKGGHHAVKFDYVVGSEGGSADVEEDTEAPVLSNATVAASGSMATVTVNVTDNSGSAIITITNDADDSVLAEKTVVADGTDQTIQITGLAGKTTYNITVSAKDASGNVATDSKKLNFTIGEIVEVSASARIPGESSYWDGACQQHEYFPPFNITITTTGSNTLKFDVSMDDKSYIDVVRVFVKGVSTELTGTNGEYSGETTATYTTDDKLDIYVRFINYHYYESGVAEVWTTPFYYVVGGTTITNANGDQITTGITAVKGDQALVYGAAGRVYVAGAEGQAVRVYSVAGQLLHSTVAAEQTAIELPRGIYIVTVGNKVKKIAL